MSLFDGIPLDGYDTPVGPAQAKPAGRAYVVTLKQASNGREILICSVTPPPAAALVDAKERKLPLFTMEEINEIRLAGHIDPRNIDLIIEARQVFGWGGSVTCQKECA